MKKTFESAEDLAIDIPKKGIYLGRIYLLSPFLQEEGSIEFPKELVEPISGTHICVDFIVKILQNASKRLVSLCHICLIRINFYGILKPKGPQYSLEIT
jgi:hypothetical protein